MTDPTPASDALVAELREALAAVHRPGRNYTTHSGEVTVRFVECSPCGGIGDCPECDGEAGGCHLCGFSGTCWPCGGSGELDSARIAFAAAVNPAAIASLLARLKQAEADRDRWKARAEEAER